MPDTPTCPNCGSAQTRLLDGIVTTRFVEQPDGKTIIERICRLFRCLGCGRNFDEVDEGDEADAEEGDEPPFQQGGGLAHKLGLQTQSLATIAEFPKNQRNRSNMR